MMLGIQIIDIIKATVPEQGIFRYLSEVHPALEAVLHIGWLLLGVGTLCILWDGFQYPMLELLNSLVSCCKRKQPSDDNS